MCSPKTMLKIGVAMAVPLAIGFVAFPQFRIAIIGLAPFALFAICPLSMIFCMGMMGGNDKKSCSSCQHNHAEGAKHVEVQAEK